MNYFRKICFIFFSGLLLFISVNAKTTAPLFIDNNTVNSRITADLNQNSGYLIPLELNTNAIWSSNGDLNIKIGDYIPVNFNPQTNDTILVKNIFQYINGTVTLYGYLPRQEFSSFYLTFTDDDFIGFYQVPEENQAYRFIYDKNKRQHYLTIDSPEYNDFLEDGEALVPPQDDETQFDILASVKRYQEQIPDSIQAANTIIDVMVLYTTAAKNWAVSNESNISNTISQAMSLAQTSLDNSQIDITLNLVFTTELLYTEANNSYNDLNNLTFQPLTEPDDPHASAHGIKDVPGLRNYYGADLVTLLTLCEDVGGVSWGLVNANGAPNYGYSLVRVQQASWTYTMVHEWGHTMGADHRKDQVTQPGPGLYTYSAGWRWIGNDALRYCSVMSYQEQWDNHTVFRTGYFSNPYITYKGAATGVADDADNARTLQQIRSIIAGYRSVDSPDRSLISGYVLKENGDPIKNVVLTFSYNVGSATTNNYGYYQLSVPLNWSGTITPSISGQNYAFNPIYKNLNNVTSNQSNVNFTGYNLDPDYIKVLAPNGGENWTIGNQRIITWTSNTIDEKVKIDLYKNNVFIKRLKENNTNNDGDFTWDIDGSIAPGTDYKIRITGVTSLIYDESDQKFVIKNSSTPSAPALLSPVNYAQNVDVMPRLVWAPVSDALFHVQVASNSGFSSLVVDETNVSASFMNIPAWKLNPGQTFFWRVLVQVDGVNSAWSPSFQFQTTSIPNMDKVYIENLLPASYQFVCLEEREKYYTDRDYIVNTVPDSFKNLSWIRTANSDKSNTSSKLVEFDTKQPVRVFLAYDSRATAAPQWLSAQFEKTDNKIFVSDVLDNFDVWKSDVMDGHVVFGGNLASGAAGAKANYFVLLQPEEIIPTLALTSPVGGEKWRKGQTCQITWSSKNVNDQVRIDLLKDDSYFYSIKDNAENTGSFSWTIPVQLTSGQDFKIRISALSDSTIKSTSPDFFTIEDIPVLTLTAPVGGEKWFKGESYALLWTTQGDTGDSVSIDLIKAGVPVNHISASTQNNGNYVWTIPSDIAVGADYKILVTSRSDSAVTGTSPAVFSIADKPQITLISPVGGDVWLKGATYNILWTSAGDAGDSVSILIYKDAFVYRQIAKTVPISAVFSWTIPLDFVTGDDFKIRITSRTKPDVMDTSMDFFSIVDKPQILLSHPDGGETWFKTSSYSITWTKVGDTGDSVSIDLFKGDAQYLQIEKCCVNTGSYSWQVPGDILSANDYKVKITSRSNIELFDKSSSDFAIVEEPGISLLTPHDGDVLLKGAAKVITWSTTGDTGDSVKIELYKNSVMTKLIAESVANSGLFEWTVPADAVTGTDYKIRVTSKKDTNVWGENKSPFTITDKPQIVVNSPKGGEIWLKGTGHILSWMSVGSVSNSVKIELLKSGIVDMVLTAGIANTGSFIWNVPVNIATGIDYKIRVISLTDTAVTGESPQPFSITDQTQIVITSPQGGEVWYKGTGYTINWESVGDIGDSVKIDLCKTGLVYKVITNGILNDGSFVWQPPQDILNGPDFKIRVTSLVNSNYKGESVNNFTIIDKPQITVVYPTGGEVWLKGSTHTLSWSSRGDVSDSVKIDLYKTGQFYTEISSGVENNGSFIWPIPTTIVTAPDYKIRISCLINPACKGESGGSFTIKDKPQIVLVSPNGGEEWRAGSTKSILWTSVGDAGDSVNIELLLNNEHNDWLTFNAANNGEYPWEIPLNMQPGTLYKIKIASLGNKNYFDASDLPFSIAVWAPDKVTLVSPENNSKLSEAHPVLEWAETENAESYQLQLGADAEFNSILMDTTVAVLSLTFTNSLPDAIYYWRVCGIYNNNPGEWSDVYSFTISSTGILNTAGLTIPDAYYIYQNYPNPFNPTTTILFGLPKEGYVRIVVYNINGQLVNELLSQQVGAGSYRVNWNAQRFPSGVYYYHIDAAGYHETKKMVLCK